MTSLLAAITEFIAAHPHLAYIAVFILALSESIPIIGVVVPGSGAIFAIATLVPSGVVTLWPLLAGATAGAIVGDGVSFLIGYRYQSEILERWPLNRFPELVARSRSFFTKYGDKSVFLARFTPGLRSFVPLLAGILRMPASRFYIANISSALVWAPAHTLPGVLVGASVGLLGAAAKPIAILLVLLIVLLWAVIHAVRFTLRRGVPLLSSRIERLQAWSDTKETRPKRIVFALLDPSRPQFRGIAVLALLLVCAAWLFLGILEDVVSGDPLVRIDSGIYHALRDLRSPPSDSIMIAITELGDTTVVIAVTIAALLWLLWRRAWRTAAYWIMAIAGASGLNSVIKFALHRPRPGETFYTDWSAFSFPSGHSTVNVVLYGFLAFLIARELSPLWRLPVALGAAILVLLIAFSRLYLGAHWFSDAAGGLAFGTMWLTTVGIFYVRRRHESVGPVGLLFAGCAALVVAGGINVLQHHALDVERYAIETTVPSMAAETWWTTGWQQLPDHRIDLVGEVEEPLTVQWAGRLSDLEATLLNKGWQRPAPWTSLSSLSWFTATAQPSELPALATFANGRLPSLILIRQLDHAANGSRLVLRLWPVDLELTNGKPLPVWVGSVVEQRLARPVSLITWVSSQPDMNAPRDSLAEALPGGRLAQRTDEGTDASWDGRVLLLREQQ